MSDLTRSMEATGAGAAARVEQQRRALPNGVWGMALLIATEAALFGTMLASYYYLRFQTSQWPPPGIARPEVLAPAILTGILVATTVPMFLAARAAGRGHARAAMWLLLVAALVQGGYLGVQIHLFLSDLHKFSPGQTAYGSVYFTILFLHHVHVFVGIALVLWLAGRLIGGLTNYRLTATRAIAFYWYFVNAMAILVVLTQLYPSL